MFAFEHWADWLKSKASALSDKGLTCTYGDTIDVPECASNPGCELRVTSSEWLGSFRFWKAGTCDYEIMDTSTNEFAADEAMLRACAAHTASSRAPAMWESAGLSITPPRLGGAKCAYDTLR